MTANTDTTALTFATVKTALNAIGLTIVKVEGNEYRINFRGSRENSAYYTSDLDDALNTGRHMHNTRTVTAMQSAPGHMTPTTPRALTGDVVAFTVGVVQRNIEAARDQYINECSALIRELTRARAAAAEDRMLSDTVLSHSAVHAIPRLAARHAAMLETLHHVGEIQQHQSK